MRRRYTGPFLLLCTIPSFAFADAPDSGDTAWMMISCALVLMMTLPGLALFYGGLVKRENLLSSLMQTFSACCLASVLWAAFGYSLAFTEGNGFIGGFQRIFLDGLILDAVSGTIPESVFILFQMTFAIITPALIFGAVADRMRFGAMFVFTGLWVLLVYAPVAHWVWGPGGWIGGTGIVNFHGPFGLGAMIDFAGGTVVHVNAGVAGLVAAIVVGRRRGFGSHAFLPNNLMLSVIGAALLWVGWFGFNAGSALTSGSRAGMAMLTTHIAASAAAIGWLAIEWKQHGKPSILGIISGAVAGLVAITPASGFVDVKAAFAIGLISGMACYWSASALKKRFRYDDSLDVFGIHGVGGIVGSLLTGLFASAAIGGVPGVFEGNPKLLLAQALGTVAVAAYSAIATYGLLKLTAFITPLRVDAETEFNGLDLALHGERVP